MIFSNIEVKKLYIHDYVINKVIRSDNFVPKKIRKFARVGKKLNLFLLRRFLKDFNEIVV